MRKFNKNIAKEFKTSFGRFIAIMAIIALGVGFLIGVTQATPDMKNTMSTYLIDNQAYDIDVKGTYGLTQADIDAIRALKDDNGDALVESVTPVISTDAVVTAGGHEGVVGRFIGIENLKEYANADADTASGNLNTLTLVEGEWPDAAGEVVVAQPTNYFERVNVGDTIVLPETIGSSQATYGDIYVSKTYTVTGIVSSPDYFYRDAREVTTLGSGVIGCVVYGEMSELYDLQKSGSLFSYLSNESIMGIIGAEPIAVQYTDCYIKLRDSENYERFTDGYKNFVLEGAESLETLGKDQIKVFTDLIAKAEENGFGSIIAGMGLSADSVQWLVLDRANTNVSYVSYDMNVEKVEEIAGIFPIFFIVVAAISIIQLQASRRKEVQQ